MISVKTYFEQNPTPANLPGVVDQAYQFVSYHKLQKRPVVLITSGGTIVPLEKRTIRFIDNFSAGTRGSASAEYFIAEGYAVVYLYRRYSLEPYNRTFSKSIQSFLDYLEDDDDGCVRVKKENMELVKKKLRAYKRAVEGNKILKISFLTVSEYLFYLKGVAQVFHILEKAAMFYLAAAVSDFFIPHSNMHEHKIQSSEGPLHIALQPVPKVLEPMVKEWAPHSFIVSFKKLETDETLLLPKARAALSRYGHQAVIGNLLHERKLRVVVVTRQGHSDIRLAREEVSTLDIEKYIVAKVKELHIEHMLGDSDKTPGQ